ISGRCRSRRPVSHHRCGCLLLAKEGQLFLEGIATGQSRGQQKDRGDVALLHRVPPSGSRARLTMESNTLAPAPPPISGSAIRSRCGIIPTTFRSALVTPAMSLVEPFGFSPM